MSARQRNLCFLLQIPCRSDDSNHTGLQQCILTWKPLLTYTGEPFLHRDATSGLWYIVASGAPFELYPLPLNIHSQQSLADYSSGSQLFHVMCV